MDHPGDKWNQPDPNYSIIKVFLVWLKQVLGYEKKYYLKPLNPKEAEKIKRLIKEHNDRRRI